VYNQIGQNP